YSVGVLLYELLAGVPLIDETDEWRALEAVRNGRWQRLAQRAPHLPPALIAVVEDALSVDPELRPRSAAAFARQLSPFISPVANSESETKQRFAPSYCPSNALSKVPQPHHDSACPGDLLLAPTFPRSPPAPRLEAL